MINIAIVDDLSADSSLLKKYVQAYYHNKNTEIQLSVFASGEEFAATYRAGFYQLIFLDIYMKDINGMEVAHMIRNAIQLHTDAGVLKSYQTFQSFEELIREYDCFLSCYRGCIVNMDRIREAQDEGFLMDNEDFVPVRKRGSNTIRKAYLQYLFGSV